MCARYTLKSSASVLQELFDLDDPLDMTPRYNIAPTQAVPGVVAEGGKHVVKWFQWGLVPGWAKDISIGQKLINARCETVHEKPSFRGAFKYRRCLIPADGFIEWSTEFVRGPEGLFDEGAQPKKTYKQPHYLTMADGRPFAFAGIWEHFENGEAMLETCAILTTESNFMLGDWHDRMPVILDPEDYDIWLQTPPEEAQRLKPLCRPYPEELMRDTWLSTKINSSKVEGKDVLVALA